MKQDKYSFDEKDYLVKVKPTSKKALKVLTKKEQKLKEEIFKLSEGYSNSECIRVFAFLINKMKGVKR